MTSKQLSVLLLASSGLTQPILCRTLRFSSHQMALGYFFKTALLLSIVFHLVISPYTKVEESFNIQAIHDISNYGIWPDGLTNYDHNSFPGVVPRTFVGSLVVSGIAYPIIKVLGFFGLDLMEGDQLDVQMLVRLIIGLINGWMIIKLASSLREVDFVSKKLKQKSIIGDCFVFLMVTQFHILYYSSRTLPNFLALPLVNHALGKLLKGDISGLTWLAFVGIVFRIEVGVLAVVIALVSSIGFGQTLIPINLVMLFAGTIAGLAISFTVDSYFWGELTIPELVSLKYNFFEGKSANWGVEPFNAYFSVYLTKIFRPPIVLYLSAFGFMSDPSTESTTADKSTNKISRPSKNSLRILSVSAIVYILIMSLQGHKELRFIIYTVPIFTMSAGNALSGFIRKSKGSFSTKLLVFLVVAVALAANLLSVFSGYISSFNYPGGKALEFVNDYVSNSNEPLIIHMDVATCMTGVTRFGELHDDFITYDKTEDVQKLNEIWNAVDILVTSHAIEEYENEDVNDWKKLKAIQAFKGYSLYPIVMLIQKHRSPKELGGFFVDLLVDAYHTKNFTQLKEILNAPIVLTDYIFIYERIGKTEFLKVEENTEVDEIVDEPDFDKLKEELNEEIDSMEH